MASKETLSDIIKKVNKDAGSNLISVGMKDFKRERIPFTSARMNYCLFGGLPKGQMIEFRGEEHSGKTTSAFDVVKNFQISDDDRKVLYVDTETSFDPEWATKIGVDISQLLLFTPEEKSAEFILQFVLDALKTGEIGFVVIDSIAAMFSEKEGTDDLDKSVVAGISKPLSRFSKEAVGLCHKHNTTLVGINQPRDKIGYMAYGTYTPGGREWRHLCNTILEFRKGKYIDKKGKELSGNPESPYGQTILMSMVKNKTCPPTRRTGFYTINFDTGIDYAFDLISLGIKYGIIQGSSWYNIIDVETGEVIREKIHGQGDLYNLIKDDEELRTYIENQLEKMYADEGDSSVIDEDDLADSEEL